MLCWLLGGPPPWLRVPAGGALTASLCPLPSQYLHNDKKLLHGDIKSSNVVVKGDFEAVKICDVGVSLPLDENMTGRGARGGHPQPRRLPDPWRGAARGCRSSASQKGAWLRGRFGADFGVLSTQSPFFFFFFPDFGFAPAPEDSAHARQQRMRGGSGAQGGGSPDFRPRGGERFASPKATQGAGGVEWMRAARI